MFNKILTGGNTEGTFGTQRDIVGSVASGSNAIPTSDAVYRSLPKTPADIGVPGFLHSNAYIINAPNDVDVFTYLDGLSPPALNKIYRFLKGNGHTSLPDGGLSTDYWHIYAVTGSTGVTGNPSNIRTIFAPR